MFDKCCSCLRRSRDTSVREDRSPVREDRSPAASSHFGPRRYTYEDLCKATGDFRALLGKGGYGAVFKGTLREDGAEQPVAVKRFFKTPDDSEKPFNDEASMISKLHHRNMVRLFGWCHDQGQMLLVYEYMPNGSLADVLHNDARCAELNWKRRYEIAVGLGAVLLYLHEGSGDGCILHRDIKPRNVLLNEDFIPKLGDFGLSRQISQGKMWHSTGALGTPGYMAPELRSGEATRRATRETDVYAFGTVLLELTTGKRPIEERSKGPMLVDWVWDLYGEEKELEAVDGRLSEEWDEDEARRMLVVGLACTHPDMGVRLKIKPALQVLERVTDLPHVPRRKPTPMFISSLHKEGNGAMSAVREGDRTDNWSNGASLSQSAGEGSNTESTTFFSNTDTGIYYDAQTSQTIDGQLPHPIIS